MSLFNSTCHNRRCCYRAFTLVEILVVISIIALLLALILPSLNLARESARKIQCGSNLHQIALAVQMYSENNKGSLIIAGVISPLLTTDEILSIWHSALLPYVEKAIKREPQFLLDNTTSVWFCPSDRDPYPIGFRNYPHNKRLTSYAPNGYYPIKILPNVDPPDVRLGPAGGYSFTNIRQPSSCFLMGETSYAAQFYDADEALAAGYNLSGDGHHRSTSGFYHNGSMNLLYVDGHVESIKGEKTEEEVWPQGFESLYQSGKYMYWPDLTLPSAEKNSAFWGPGY